MQKHSFFIALICFLLISGCSYFNFQRGNYANVFKDVDSPCMEIDFGSQIEILKRKTKSENNFKYVLYSIAIPGSPYYKIEIVKITSIDHSMTIYPEEIYKIYGEGKPIHTFNKKLSNEKIGSVVLRYEKSGVYLRSIVVEKIQERKIYAVIIDRIVQNNKYSHLFNYEDWSNTSVGKKMISQAISSTDKLYENMKITRCEMIEIGGDE